jgi:putative FmdB family regulatory protein
MPIYGYACKSCGHTLDALQKMADDPLVDCPECNEPALKRQLSAPRFRLKGQGWYETDFKKDNQRNLASDKEPAKPDTKSDPKVADKKVDKKVEKKSESSSTPKAPSKSSGDKAKAG